MRLMGLTILCLLLAALPAAVLVADGPVPLHQHPTLRDMLRRNNELRGSRGLPPHRMNPALTRAAQDHAWYMARTGNFSHHSNAGPLRRALRFGFRGQVRENIAAGQRSVQQTFASWQSSSGHWASIVSHTTDAGFGYAIAPNGTTYWVAVYGTESVSATSADAVVLEAQPIH